MNGDLDYGEGKTREQETRDSTVMLALVIVWFALVLIAGLTFALLWLIF